VTALAPNPEVSTAKPLGRLQDLIARYVIVTDEQRLIIALWIVHSHIVGHLNHTAYLAVTSPEKQCGKTQLLLLIRSLVPRPWLCSLPSEAVVYRNIDANHPTLLMDETDAIFNPRTADRYEGLRAILNNGYRTGIPVPRCIGNSSTPQDFHVFGAKVLAGIGALPDTVADRSIPIRLERKRKTEKVTRFRDREVEALAEPIRTAVEAWAAANGETVAAARPALPDELSDRIQDGAEAIIAIADMLGCGDDARHALVHLTAEKARTDSSESLRLQLLRDTRAAFAIHGDRNLQTKELLQALYVNEDGFNWLAGYYGRKLEDRDLASLLRDYGISSHSVWSPPLQTSAKGYRYDDFVGPWERYLTAGLPGTEEPGFS
jgi:hypothetical protein